MEKIVKRIHFKGRGKTERPVCPKCGEDLKRTYTRVWNPKTKRGTFVTSGWECEKDQYKIWDKK